MTNILIPMAGLGSRFQKTGLYNFPKPLVNVNGKPMIQVLIESLNINGNYIFMVLREHYEKYILQYLLPLICKDNSCKIVIVETITEGAACTALLAKELINNDDELIIVNSDQWLNWNSEYFLKFVREKDASGAIVSFIATDSKWSFVKVNEETNLITEVAEKKPISNIATAGVYYFAKGSDFVWASEQMISKNIRTNNEFYIAPSFNELIEAGKNIYNFPIAELCGLGTPEDLAKFLSNHKE